MASIITATTSSGITQSADNSGVLQLASGVGNNVTIPAVSGTAMVSGNMPAFSAYANSGTSCANNTWTKIAFDTEEFDTNNNFSSSRFTPTVAGYYQITAAVEMITSPDTSCNPFQIAIYKNGSAYKDGPISPKNSNVYPRPGVEGLVYCNGTTDYIEIYVWFFLGSGTALTSQTGSYGTYFQAAMIRNA